MDDKALTVTISLTLTERELDDLLSAVGIALRAVAFVRTDAEECLDDAVVPYEDAEAIRRLMRRGDDRRRVLDRLHVAALAALEDLEDAKDRQADEQG